MARFRTLDAEMLKAHETKGLSGSAWLVLDRMILGADDEGRLDAEPEALRATLFPRGLPRGWNADLVWEAVVELHAARVVAYYQRAGREVLCLPGWKYAASWQYQSIKRPIPSLLPAPQVKLPDTRRTPGNAPKGPAPDDDSYAKFRNCLEKLSEQFAGKEGRKEGTSFFPSFQSGHPDALDAPARGSGASAPPDAPPAAGPRPVSSAEKRTSQEILTRLKKKSDPSGKIGA